MSNLFRILHDPSLGVAAALAGASQRSTPPKPDDTLTAIAVRQRAVTLAMHQVASRVVACLLTPALAVGCAPAPRSVAPAPSAQASPLRPAALVDGTPVDHETLAALALEAAGAVTFEEAALDLILARELAGDGLSLADDASAIERQRLFSRIAAEAGVAEEQAGTLVDRFRTARGLGPRRFEALLRRNAALRMLASRGGLVDEATVASLTEAELGPRATARIIVTRTTAEATRIHADIVASAIDARSARFAQHAFTSSSDPSSARGGLFGPVSHTDPTIPSSVRPSLSLPAGELSPVIAIDQGFAVLLIESQLEAAVRTSEAVAAAKAKATARVEREAMDALAARLLAEARITVMDEHLQWAWERRPR